MTMIFVGTSGWLYDWNVGGNFDWYLKFSGLNIVELNMSFYRFPFRNQINSWVKKNKGMRWIIKVHRSITHYRKLSRESYNVWFKFRELFKPLDSKIDFYLFQLPPNYVKNSKNIDKLKKFSKMAKLNSKFSVEFRHKSWFNEDTIRLCRNLGLTAVSIDSPMGKWIIKSDDTIYLRMHGRGVWYAYDYSVKELKEIADELYKLNPQKVYVLFNNNHWMLNNARTMLKLLREVFV